MAGLKILIGADKTAPAYEFEYSKSHIMDFSGTAASSMVGDELTIDQVTFTVNLDKYYRTLYAPTDADAYQDTTQRIYAVKEAPGVLADDLSKLEYATPVWVYQGDSLVGKFYSGNVERTGYAVVSITAESAFGVLDHQRHLGNVYTGQSFQDVLREIVNGAFPYTVANELSEIKVYNWLPIDTKRNNIHQLLYAHGVNVGKDENGDMVFGYLEQTSVVSIEEERVFMNGVARYTPPATQVEVIEHNYFKQPSDTPVILFDNSDDEIPAGNLLVSFDQAPIYELTSSTGLIIHESGANYAIVSGFGSLKGKPYNHQLYRVLRTNKNAGEVEKIVTSQKCTLVSILNSSNVARRLLSYHSSAQSFLADIAVNNEKPGDQIQFTNPFGEKTTAFIASMQYSITGFMRSRCELITDYIPTPPGGGNFTHIDVITASGKWMVPDGVLDAAVILIGGGQGGTAGGDGKDGLNGYTSTVYNSGYSSNGRGGSYGSGGGYGSGGSAGKIFQTRLALDGISYIEVKIGHGGSGAAKQGQSAAYGGATEINANGAKYSSDDGTIKAGGYYEILEKKTYAVDGKTGYAGSRGGDGGGYSGSKEPQSGNDGYQDSWTGAPGKGAIPDGVKVEGGLKTVYAKPAESNYSTDSTERSEPVGYPDYQYGYIDLTFSKWNVDAESGWKAPSGASAVRKSYAELASSGKELWVISTGSPLYLMSKKYSFSRTSYGYNYYIETEKSWRVSELESYPGWYGYRSGGGGGGGARFVNGLNAIGQIGGNGANGGPADFQTTPGSGGNGGNGGGGGGGGGGSVVFGYNNAKKSDAIPGGAGGSGGKGSAGGDGAPGCVLIYY